MATFNDSSVNFLGSSREAFRNGNRGEGFKNFCLVSPQDQHKVYEPIWVDRNRPKGNLEFGRQSFHDTNGLYSTVQEKAEAINKYLINLEYLQRLVAQQGYKDFCWSHRDGWQYADNYANDNPLSPVKPTSMKETDFSDLPKPDCGENNKKAGLIFLGVVGGGALLIEICHLISQLKNLKK